MRIKTKKIALTAIFAAIAIALLYLASAVPTGRLALIAVAGLFSAAAVVEGGRSAGFMCFAVTALVALLVLPLKSIAFVYLLFPGWYPVAKSFIERIRPLPLEWLLKLLAFNAAITAALIVFLYGFLDGAGFPEFAPYLVYAAGNIVFVLYDITVSKLVFLYVTRVSVRIGKK